MTRKYRTDTRQIPEWDDSMELDYTTLDDERYIAELARQCAQYERDYAIANDIHGDY